MATSRRLTPEEISQRRAILDAEREKRENDPNQVARREWVKKAFKFDLDAISNFAATLMLQGQIMDKENQELVEKLNQINRQSYYLAPNTDIPAYIKANVARMTLEHAPDDPVSLAFVSGMGVSKHLQAAKSASIRHAENRAMKAEVFTWLNANMVNFKSMDKAAESIAGTIAPIGFRTARVWVGEWKKLRSAGTP